MYFKGYRQQLMEGLALLFAISFVIHLVGLWLAPLVPVVVAVAVLAVVARLIFVRRR